MVPSQLLLADAAVDTAQAELLEHNHFALRSTVTSTATLPKQGQAGCSGELVLPRAAGSLLKDPRMARHVAGDELVSSLTDTVEAPAQEPSMTTPGVVLVGDDDRQSAPSGQHSVCYPTFPPH